MTREPTEHELLNAYLDEELSASDRSRIERRLAQSSELRDELARLAAVKQALGALRPAALEPPEAPARPLNAAARRSGIALAAAAALALFAFGVAERAPAPEAAGPVALHDHYAARHYDAALDGPRDAPGVWPVGARAIAPEDAPDLSASRLALVAARVERDGDEIVSARHYRGPNGCRLSFISIRGAAQPIEARDGRLVASWSVGSIAHYVLADGMDRARFDAIAAFLRAGTSLYHDAPELMVAMGRATEAAQPCV